MNPFVHHTSKASKPRYLRDFTAVYQIDTGQDLRKPCIYKERFVITCLQHAEFKLRNSKLLLCLEW